MQKPLILTYADSPLGRGTFEQDLLKAIQGATTILVMTQGKQMFFYPRHNGGTPELSIYEAKNVKST